MQARCRRSRRIQIVAALAWGALAGMGSHTAQPGDEPGYSIVVESSTREQTVLTLTVAREADVQGLHLLPFENPPQHPPRELPQVKQATLGLGDATFAAAPLKDPGRLSFLRRGGSPPCGRGTYRIVLDWVVPEGSEVDYIGLEVALTTNRDANHWTESDLVGGRAVRLEHEARIPAIVPAGAPAAEPRTEITLETGAYRLVAPAGLHADAHATRAALDRGIAALTAYFRPHDVAALLSKGRVSIRLHASPDEKADVGRATSESGTSDGTLATYFCRVHVLAPSAHPADARTAAGEPMDAAYCARVLVHEVSTAVLDLLTRSKATGWRFFEAPAWFVQGYEEYLGLTCSDPEAGRATLAKYVAQVKAHPEWVAFDFGLEVKEPYVAGAVLLQFLHERFGAAKVASVLTSAEPTFARALRANLGLGVDALGAEWMRWLGQVGAAR